MKLKIRLLMTLLTLIFFTFACQESGVDDTPTLNDQTSDVDNPNQEGISFTAQMNAPITKATETAFDNGDEISVTAYAADGSIYIQNIIYSYELSQFTSENPINYASNISELSFAALYPYVEINGNKASFTVQSDQDSDSNYTLSDLMFGYADLTSENSPQLTFDHLLTKIIINITSSDVSMEGATALLNTMSSLSIDISTLASTTVDSTATITMANNGTNSFKAIIVPQTINNDTPFGTISTNDGDFELYVTSAIELQGGSQYTINASIKESIVAFDAPIINDWEEASFENIITYDGAVFSLATIPTDGSTIEDDVWVITDEGNPSSAEFANLKSALNSAGNERKITLYMPYITSIPDYSITTYYDIEGTYISGGENYNLTIFSAPKATAVEAYAFFSCRALVSVSLPEVTSVGYGAFDGCYAIESISLPAATSIEEGAFSGCTSLKTIVTSNHFSYNEGLLIELNEQKLIYASPVIISSTIVNSNIKEVGDRALYYCSALESVSLPEVTKVGDHAFYRCSALESVSLPEVIEMGTSVFGNCSALESVSLPQVTKVEDYAFMSCSALESVSLPEVTKVGDYAFYRCSALESVSLPQVVEVGNYAFLSCNALESVSLPAATSIGSGIFWSCSLKSLTIATESTVLSMDANTFTACTTTSIDLITGMNNGSTVSGTYWTVGDNTFGAFNSITLYGDRITECIINDEINNLTLSLGESQELSASIIPINITNYNILWESSDPTIATVSDGLITAISPGKAVITVYPESNSDIYDTCVVTVRNAPTPCVDLTEIGHNRALIYWVKEDASNLITKYNFYVDGYSDPVVVEKVDAFIGSSISGTTPTYTTNCAIVDFSQIPGFDTDFETQDINVSMSFTNSSGTESETSEVIAINDLIGDKYLETLGHAMISGVENNQVTGGAGFYSMTWSVPSYCTGIDLTYTNTNFAETTTEYSFAKTSFIMMSDAMSGDFSYTTNYEFGFRTINGVDYIYNDSDDAVLSGEAESGDYIYIYAVKVTGGTGSFK